MTETNQSSRANLAELKLPRRDWILLPLLGLLTLATILTSTELIARLVFPEAKSDLGKCLIEGDRSTGVRGIPNSVCSEEGFEFGRVEYRFNGSGYRAGMESLPRQPATYRVVMVGTSTAFGAHLSREKTIAVLLPAALSQQTGRKAEVYNEALTWETPHSLALRFNDVLAARPDMILWILTPWDVANASPVLSPPSPQETGGLVAAIRKRAKESRTGSLLQHLLYSNSSSYVTRALAGARGADFLRDELNAEWLSHLRDFDRYAAVIEGRANDAGIPLVAVYVPERAQAAMISMGEWSAGYNPYRLSTELHTIIVSHGGTFIDILPGFRSIPNPEGSYFPADGHPDGQGHAVISGLMCKELTGGAVPALRAAAPLQNAREIPR
jgi:hypothetical protein